MATGNNTDKAASMPCFDLDMQVETVIQGGGGGFRTAVEENGELNICDDRVFLHARFVCTYNNVIMTFIKEARTSH